MVYFRNPKYVERYEDVYYELDTALALPGNHAYQKKWVIVSCLTVVENQTPSIGIMPD